MKKLFISFTAIMALALCTTVSAQSGTTGGGQTGGGTTTGTQTRDQKGSDATGKTGGDAGKAGDMGKTGGTGSSGAAADLKKLRPLPPSDVLCCSDIRWSNNGKDQISVADDPFKGRFAGKKITIGIKDSKGTAVPSSRFKLVKDADGNIVILPSGLTGKSYNVTVKVDGMKDMETYPVKPM